MMDGITDIFRRREAEPEAVPQTGWKQRAISEADERMEWRAEQRQKFGIEVSDEEYEQIGKVIAEAENPQDESYKIALAGQYAKWFDIPLSEAYLNVDVYTEAYTGKAFGEQDHKGAWEAIGDAFIMGNNTVRMGELGNLIRDAMQNGDEESARIYTEEYNALAAENFQRQDNVPRNIFVEAAKAGAQSAPYTGRVMLVSAFGSLAHPVVGAGAGFVYSSNIMRGQEFMELLNEGADLETANKVSIVSGALQGAVEATLGNVAGFAGAATKAVGGKALAGLSDGAIAKVAEGVARRFHFGAGKKLAVNVAMNYAKETVEEGAEEALQELVSIVAHDVAAELAEYEIEPQTREEIGQRLAEAFKGGMLGSLILGLPAAGINSAVGVKELRTVREQARTMESEEAFVAATKDSPVFTQYGNNAESTAREVWKSYQRDRDERLRTEVEEQAEVTTAEGSVAEDETAETFRNEDGSLYTETESNGNEGTFKTGTPEEAENNTYGYINYTVDENANSVTIDEFKMAEGREGLRAEFYDSFAENFAGYDIRWEAKGNTAKRIKADLERANVSGRGLNYYTSVDSVTDTRTRVRVARELKQYMPMLNDRQRAAGVTLLEAMAKGQGESISAFVRRNFGASIFGDVQEAEALAQAQGDTFQGKAGATTWRQFGNEVRAVIYAGENADFSTFAHELAHVYQRQLTGDLKTQAEQAFGVQNGDWLNSRYTFSDGTVQSAAEAFAYGFQDWLKTGKAPNEQMSNIFQKFAEFLASCLNALREHINLTKDITDTYDAMLKADDSVLAQAEQAVARQERERLAREAREAEQARQEAEAQSRAEAFDAGEVTVQEETRTEERTVQAEAQPETTVLSAPGTEGAVETMRDADASVAEKTETAMDAAEAEKAFEDVVFQLAGTQAIQNVARAETRARLEESLANANELELKFMRQNLDERTRAQRVKLATGWERNPDGDWIYETDDSQAVVKNQAAIRQLIANKQEMREGVTVGDLLDYPELYEMYPDVRNINVLLFNDRLAFRSMVTPRGILLNLLYFNGMNGEKGLKASLLHEIQHWISATERGQGIDLYATRDLWNQAQRTAANPTPANINTMNEIARRVADDPGEFEPQIVSRRIALSGDARRRSLAFDDSRIVFQIAGISGAMNLDAAEESTRRMDDLNVAMEMEGAGKDARTIRLATGWERGVDRMWRYEIDDSTIDTKYQPGFLQEQTEAYRLFEELFDSGVADRVWNGTATDEERARFEELDRATTQEIEARHRRYEEAFADYHPFKDGFLADFLDFPELYEAYPELREMRVRRKRLGEGEKGRVSRKDNEIWINEMLTGYSFRSTLLHEIQHVIQDAEGFARGGSPGGFHKVEATQFDRALARYADYTAEELDGFSAEAVLDNYRLMLGDDLDSVSPEIDGIGRVEDEIERMVRNIGAERTRELIQSAKEAADADGKVLVDGRTYDSVYEAYRSIAGEVEARNVQSRMEYTTEERRQRLLAETADVAPEDQLVLFQMHEIQENREIDDIRAKYMGTERWMKAPNGKETNLSERQWLQVRTPSFKAWFGDWETKGAGASMAVDENGEPKVFYHGTRFAGFSVFNSTGKHHSNAPDGVSFFSDDRNTAMSYARASGDTVRLLDEDHVRAGIYEVFLNVREDDIGEEEDFEGANWDGQAIGKYQAISQDGEVFFTEDGRQLFDSREEADEALEDAGEKPWDYDIVEDPFVFDTTDAIAERVARANNPDVFAVVYNVVDSGGDIDVHDPQTEYIIKNPAQIKSATDNSGFFSPDNPDILFQSAYHGSPHNFDRFSTEAIGTGEGAQAFGWGLYFSNNRGIAEGYAKKLTIPHVFYNGELASEARKRVMAELEVADTPNAETAREILITDLMYTFIGGLAVSKKEGDTADYYRAEIERRIAEHEKDIKYYIRTGKKKNAAQIRDKEAIIEAYRRIDPDKIETEERKRNLYTVDIPDGDYIDWYEPLTDEQIAKVVEQIRKEDIKDIKGEPPVHEENGRWRFNGLTSSGEQFYEHYLVPFIFGSDKEASLFLARAGIKGIRYPANSRWGNSDKDYGTNYVVFDENDISVQDHLLFQSAYHGSPHNFDRFSTEAIGTGEGAQAFGWGLYFTNNKGIAEWYATKLAKGNEITYAGKMPEALNKKMGEYFANCVRALVRRVYDGTSPDYETAKKELIAYLQGLIDRNVLSEYGVEQEREKIAVIEKIDPKKIDVKKIRNLYTVEIPDGDYIKWDEPLPEEQERKIQAQAEKEGRAELAQQSYSFPMEFFITYRGESVPMLEDLPPSPTKEMKAVSMIATRAIRGGTSFYDEFDKARREGENDDLLDSIDPYLVSINVSPEGREDGKSVYFFLNKFFPNDKDKSLFLARAGFAGIDYPANSISGSWKDEGRNFVVFNDEDVRVRDHILFQTERELMEDAASFDTWQEWMEYYESFGKPEDNIVPEGADAAWYKGVWELSREWKKPVVMDTDTPERADEKFLAELSEPGVLEDFLAEADREVRQELWNPADAEEEAEIQAIQARQERIRNTLRHGSWLSNARRIAEGKELTPTTRQRLLTLAGNAARDYRAIFAELMDREEYAVAEEDTTAAQMKKRYRLKGGDDIENKSPEQRRRIARELANEEVARRLESGEMPMGSELQGYIDSLNREIRENKKLYEDLLKETQADYSRISGWEDRQLLAYHDKLMEAKEKAEEMTAEIRRKVERGIRVTQKAQKEASTLRATYDSVFRKFEAMRKAMTVTAEVTDAIKRREDLSALRSRVKERQREKRLVEQEKKIRIQLVKRAMRRVSFEAVDYNKGRVITAVQRLFEPNLLGGVNRWIGTEGAYLRSVYSRWTTDDDFREELRRRLVRSPSGQKAIRLLDATDTIEKFNAWTKKERELLHRVVPGEDWIRELGLQELAEERSKIQLDIDERREVSGGMEKVTLVPSEELRRDIEEALGADLAALMSRPFAEWTTVEMERFAKRINELFREGRDELKAKNLVRKARAAEIRGLIEQAVKDTGIKIDDGEPEELKRRKLEKIDRILGRGNAMRGTAEAKEKGFRAWMLSLVRGYGGARLRSVARILDGQRDGVNVRELYVRENEAYNEKERRIAERTANIAGVMREAGISLDELFANVTIENFYAGRDVTFTVDELLFFREAAKDEHSRAAVAYGNIGSLDALLDEKARYLAMDSSDAGRPGSRLYAEICDKLLERVVKEADKLDEKFKVFASAVSRDYAEQYERMNRASIDEWNMPVNRVDNYVPLVRLESNGDTNENRVREDMLGIAGMSRAGVDKGMTKSRIDIGALYQKPVETGLYKTWADSVARTEHFIAYSGYVRELNAVYRSRDAGYTRRLIEGRYGREMTRYIDSYIDETANPDATGARSELDNFVRNLRGKTATGYLAWKASSIIKQFATSPAPYLQFVSPAEYLASCLAVVRSGGKLFDAIKEKSAFMANRVMDVTVDIINEQLEKNRGKAGYALAKFNKLGMQGLETVDWVCVAPGWLACYRKKLAELEKAKDARYEERRRELRSRNPGFGAEGYRTEAEIDAEAGRLLEADNEKEAVDFADDCTRLCQPSARKADIAPFFKSSSEVAKALLQFQTSLNVIWNNIRYDLPYAVKNRQFRQVVGIVGGYVLAGVAVNMITDGLPEDDEDSEKIRRLVWYGTTQFTDAIPVFGSEVTKTVEKMLTGRTQFFGGGSDIFPMVDKFLAAAQNASGGDWDKALSKTIEGLGLLSGLPTSGAKELWRVVSGEPGIGAFWGRRE